MGQIPNEKIVKKILRAACEGKWLLLDNIQLSMEIIANLQKFIESMYTAGKAVKESLLRQAKQELKQLITDKREKGATNTATQQEQDSMLAMELMLLEQSIMQDTMMTTFNPIKQEDTYTDDNSIRTDD